MLYLKKANHDDAEEEYEFIKTLPENENGFINRYYGMEKEEFIEKGLREVINYSQQEYLPEGLVPESCFFLWEENVIVAVFRIRHCLTEQLKSGAGHIGFAVKKGMRNQGIATIGLKLALEEARKIVQEEYIYMSAKQDNIASIKVQIKNGAMIYRIDNGRCFTKIKK